MLCSDCDSKSPIEDMGLSTVVSGDGVATRGVSAAGVELTEVPASGVASPRVLAGALRIPRWSASGS